MYTILILCLCLCDIIFTLSCLMLLQKYSPLLFLENANWMLALGPLNLLFFLPKMVLLQISTYLALLFPQVFAQMLPPRQSLTYSVFSPSQFSSKSCFPQHHPFLPCFSIVLIIIKHTYSLFFSFFLVFLYWNESPILTFFYLRVFPL